VYAVGDIGWPELGSSDRMQGGWEAIIRRLHLWVYSAHYMSMVVISEAAAYACLTMGLHSLLGLTMALLS
jgi:hypothetical protein